MMRDACPAHLMVICAGKIPTLHSVATGLQCWIAAVVWRPTIPRCRVTPPGLASLTLHSIHCNYAGITPAVITLVIGLRECKGYLSLQLPS